MSARDKSPLISILGLLLWLALCFTAAYFGSRYPPGPWYAQLVKPAFTPPSWVFAPVWTILYVMMAVAAWLVWRQRGLARTLPALTIFVIQLMLNAAWTWIFFGLRRSGLAFAEILALWLAILFTLGAFRRHSRMAAALMVPYLLWVSFAVLLNFSFWRLNS